VLSRIASCTVIVLPDWLTLMSFCSGTLLVAPVGSGTVLASLNRSRGFPVFWSTTRISPAIADVAKNAMVATTPHPAMNALRLRVNAAPSPSRLLLARTLCAAGAGVLAPQRMH
jgi:hypothetical protein